MESIRLRKEAFSIFQISCSLLSHHTTYNTKALWKDKRTTKNA